MKVGKVLEEGSMTGARGSVVGRWARLGRRTDGGMFAGTPSLSWSVNVEHVPSTREWDEPSCPEVDVRCGRNKFRAKVEVGEGMRMGVGDIF